MSSPVVIWIWLCAYLNCAGWTLSALRQLNVGGYAVALALGLGALLIWQRKTGVAIVPKIHWPRLRRRFSRSFPLGFLILAALAFIGGATHPANNYDALAYRTPRVLHWLAEGQWHWIHTDFQRLNTRTAGFEWLTAPQILFLHTDRFIFLINIASFLLLPGRIFAVLTRLGVRPRAAWYWMWLFPGGYGYILQAGSIGNDMFGALLALAAMEFALRARQDGKISNLWISGLAAALMTAAKAFNILLLLPWALAVLPSFKILWRRPMATAAMMLFAAGASIAPTALLNVKHCGDWTGLKAEQPTVGGGGKGYRFLANAINLPLAQVAPPLFPFRQQWDALVARTMSTNLSAQLHGYMEPALAELYIPEMQTEETAGLGLGVAVLLSVVLIRKIRTRNFWPEHFLRIETLVPLAAWVSVGIFMAEVGDAGPARFLIPFYLLLVTPVLAGDGASEIFRRGFWRKVALGTFAVAAVLIILSPPRPLWPAKTILHSLDATNAKNHLLKRAGDVYAAYFVRADGFAPVIAALPPDAEPLGFMAFDEPETSLWRPFGSRRIEHFSHLDSPADLRARGIKYALVSEYFLRHHCRIEPADWMNRMRAEPLAHFEFKLLTRMEPHGWLLVRFQ